MPGLSNNLIARLAPAVFVFLWSTGFIAAKYGMPYAEPLTFLWVRMAGVVAILAVIALVWRPRWPNRVETGHSIVVGLLVHGFYLGGVFVAISQGVPAGISALLPGLQPVLMATLANRWLGERVTLWQWAGLALGILGVLLVLNDRAIFGAGTPLGWMASAVSLLGITIGTLYQKKFCPRLDLRSGTAIQFAATTVVLVPFALLFETRQIIWSGEFLFALGWLCIVLSLGAITLLFILIKRGAASTVSSLFFLVPPCTALVAFFLFGETLSPAALVGMAVTMVGVALVNRK